tara:strand:- start:199 stop:411 length:213 start_codon:yes stop_codon:yes gene_type:complete
VVIAITGVVSIWGKEFENTKNVTIDKIKDKIIKEIVIFLFVDGLLSQEKIILINLEKKVIKEYLLVKYTE